jgi:hypothetical protein
MDPGTYQGELGESGSHLWRNVNQVHIVNGHVEKHDANFVGGLSFDQIGHTNIYIGNYPQVEDDAQALHEAGVTGIFNVQTDTDIEHRGYNWDLMKQYYSERGMEAIHFPITDFNHDDLLNKLFDGACKINHMVSNGQKVFVHCTAGMGRAPACVLAYLCLFKKVDCWHNPGEVDHWVR